MSDIPDLAQMGEPELRAWLDRLPAQELMEIIISYIRAFLRDGADDFGASSGPLGELLEMNFAQIIGYLKDNTRLPELSRLRVEGEVVKFQTAAGSDIILNATGLQDGPGLPGLGARGGFARSTPDPNHALNPRSPSEAREGPDASRAQASPGSMAQEVGPRSEAAGRPRRLGGLFGDSASGSGEARTGPLQPRARSTGRPPTTGGPARPKEPPRVKPEKKKKKEGSDRFSMLEFD